MNKNEFDETFVEQKTDDISSVQKNIQNEEFVGNELKIENLVNLEDEEKLESKESKIEEAEIKEVIRGEGQPKTLDDIINSGEFSLDLSNTDPASTEKLLTDILKKMNSQVSVRNFINKQSFEQLTREDLIKSVGDMDKTKLDVIIEKLLKNKDILKNKDMVEKIYKTKDIRVLVSEAIESNHFKEQYKKLKINIDVLKNEVQELNKINGSEKDEQISKLEDEKSKALNELSGIKREIEEKDYEITQLKINIDELEEKLSKPPEISDITMNDTDDTEDTKLEYYKQIEILEDEKSNLKNKISELEKTIEENIHTQQKNEEELAREKNKNEELLHKIQNKEDEIQNKNSIIEEKNTIISKLENEKVQQVESNEDNIEADIADKKIDKSNTSESKGKKDKNKIKPLYWILGGIGFFLILLIFIAMIYANFLADDEDKKVTTNLKPVSQKEIDTMKKQQAEQKFKKIKKHDLNAKLSEDEFKNLNFEYIDEKTLKIEDKSIKLYSVANGFMFLRLNKDNTKAFFTGVKNNEQVWVHVNKSNKV